MRVETRIVDNRVFLLGLDDLYREAMKSHERTELLDAAESTAATLGVTAADVPIEGYYAEDAQLTRYFQLMRALQRIPKSRKSELSTHSGFGRLKAVTQSPIFGPPAPTDSILPAGNDCLSIALGQTLPLWNIETITERAYDVATQSEDISFVAVAALSRDPVVLTAIRESVVLYAYAVGGAAFIPEPEYRWQVDEAVANRATRFVAEFNELFSASLPTPTEENAEAFWDACNEWKVAGRCVRLGFDDSVQPVRHYHWAIARDASYNLVVKDFWETELWTTQRYRETQDETM